LFPEGQRKVGMFQCSSKYLLVVRVRADSKSYSKFIHHIHDTLDQCWTKKYYGNLTLCRNPAVFLPSVHVLLERWRRSSRTSSLKCRPWLDRPHLLRLWRALMDEMQRHEWPHRTSSDEQSFLVNIALTQHSKPEHYSHDLDEKKLGF